jgi:hypothetical protein
VVGRPDPEWGEAVVAFVVAADPSSAPSARRARRLCLDHIARFKRPKDYRFVESLPTNNYGKVVKRELRESTLGHLCRLNGCDYALDYRAGGTSHPRRGMQFDIPGPPVQTLAELCSRSPRLFDDNEVGAAAVRLGGCCSVSPLRRR